MMHKYNYVSDLLWANWFNFVEKITAYFQPAQVIKIGFLLCSVFTTTAIYSQSLRSTVELKTPTGWYVQAGTNGFLVYSYDKPGFFDLINPETGAKTITNTTFVASGVMYTANLGRQNANEVVKRDLNDPSKWNTVLANGLDATENSKFIYSAYGTMLKRATLNKVNSDISLPGSVSMLDSNDSLVLMGGSNLSKLTSNFYTYNQNTEEIETLPMIPWVGGYKEEVKDVAIINGEYYACITALEASSTREGTKIFKYISTLNEWVEIYYRERKPEIKDYAYDMAAIVVNGISYIAISVNESMSAKTVILSLNKEPIAPKVEPIEAKIGKSTYLNLPGFTDPENDQLTYSLTGLPAGLTFNASTRLLSGKPTVEGEFTVKYTAEDAFKATTSVEFKFIVAPNTKPEIPDFTVPMAFKSKLFSFTFPAAVDADGNPLTYFFESDILSRGMSFNNETRTLTGITTATGDFACKYVAFDGIVRTEKQFTLKVDPNTAIQAEKFELVTLYPNPASDFIIIEHTEQLKSVEIYTFSGQLIVTDFSRFDNKYELSISNLPKGNYLLKAITDSKTVFVKQFIKQ